MQRDLRIKVIDALRSGKYKQGRGYLKGNDKYCCLGVMVVEAGGRFSISCRGIDAADSENLDESTGYRILEKAPFNLTSREINDLWHMNDSSITPQSFPEIADWIEKNVSIED